MEDQEDRVPKGVGRGAREEERDAEPGISPVVESADCYACAVWNKGGETAATERVFDEVSRAEMRCINTAKGATDKFGATAARTRGPRLEENASASQSSAAVSMNVERSHRSNDRCMLDEEPTNGYFEHRRSISPSPHNDRRGFGRLFYYEESPFSFGAPLAAYTAK